jgi:hypothetical protein
VDIEEEEIIDSEGGASGQVVYTVYLITNTVNGKQYVGRTRRKLDIRWYHHKHFAHRNEGCAALGEAIRTYGDDAFRVEALETASSEEDADLREQFWISELNTMSPSGYNLTSGGRNTRLSEEAKQKNSGENNYLFGKHLSEETKSKLREKNSGENASMYGIRGEDHPMFGYHHTEEAKARIGDSARGENNHWFGITGELHPIFGRKHTPEEIERIRESNRKNSHWRGKKFSPEHRAKMSAGHKARAERLKKERELEKVEE